jgi:uncharacterized repeat protein (TIGR03803 family)
MTKKLFLSLLILVMAFFVRRGQRLLAQSDPSNSVLINASRVEMTKRVETKKPSTTFKILYRFAKGSDGGTPYGGLTPDNSGALYGTTYTGGTLNRHCPEGCGTVFRIALNKGGGWTLQTIHSFTGYPTDVSHSVASVTFDSMGNLYGTASDGGQKDVHHGGVFELSPVNGDWSESVIYNFTDRNGGGVVPSASVALYEGVLYGTTEFGGDGQGTVFSLAPGENGQWKEKTIWTFPSEAGEPTTNLIIDDRKKKCCHGNLYGSVATGPEGQGEVFKLLPGAGGSWSEKLLAPVDSSTLTIDSQGRLYGTIWAGGSSNCDRGCGSVFELQVVANQGWQLTTLYEFQGGGDGYRPDAGLAFDTAGNLYGTTSYGGTGPCENSGETGCGTVFKLSPADDGTWQKAILHSFSGGANGAYPNGGTLVIDDAGKLYGATLAGGVKVGKSRFGVVYQVTP